MKASLSRRLRQLGFLFACSLELGSGELKVVVE